MLGLSVVPGLVGFLIRRQIPESPRYSLVHGQPQQARQILEQVARENRTVLEEGELLAPANPAPSRVKDL